SVEIHPRLLRRRNVRRRGNPHHARLRASLHKTDRADRSRTARPAHVAPTRTLISGNDLRPSRQSRDMSKADIRVDEANIKSRQRLPVLAQPESVPNRDAKLPAHREP